MGLACTKASGWLQSTISSRPLGRLSPFAQGCWAIDAFQVTLLRNSHSRVYGSLDNMHVRAGTFGGKSQHYPRNLETAEGRTLRLEVSSLAKGHNCDFLCHGPPTQWGADCTVVSWPLSKMTRTWDGPLEAMREQVNKYCSYLHGPNGIYTGPNSFFLETEKCKGNVFFKYCERFVMMHSSFCFQGLWERLPAVGECWQGSVPTPTHW